MAPVDHPPGARLRPPLPTETRRSPAAGRGGPGGRPIGTVGFSVY